LDTPLYTKCKHIKSILLENNGLCICERIIYQIISPSLLRTPTGTKTGTSTLGGGCLKTFAACSSGGMVEQYSIGLFGFGCLPSGVLLTVGAPSCRDDGDPEALSPCSTRKTGTQKSVLVLHPEKRELLIEW
jgi:hypothetical protein